MSSWVRVGNYADEDLHRYVNLDQMTAAYVLALSSPAGTYGIQLSLGASTFDVFGRWDTKEDASNAVRGLVRGYEADLAL